jgi:hypothetical protein
MDAGTGFSSQVYELSPAFLHKVGFFPWSLYCIFYLYELNNLCFAAAILVIPQDWIMEQWEKNYYISSIAGAVNGSSLVVMSKGLIITPFSNIYSFITYFVFSSYFLCLFMFYVYYLGRALLHYCTLPIIVSPLPSSFPPIAEL